MSSGLLDAQGITAIPTVQTSNNSSTTEVGTVSLSNDAACARAFK